MKFIKIFLISLFVLIILAVGAIAIFISTFDVNRYKPQIISQAKAALNRDIDFKNASLAFSWANGISVKVTGMTIGEDPAFAKVKFFAVKDVSLGVDVLGYVFHKKINISDILIDSPSASIIRAKDGTLNVMSLVKAATASAPAPASAPPATKAASQAAMPAILISSIKIIGGTFLYQDFSQDPALMVEIDDAALSIDHLSLTEPFGFVAQGTVVANNKKIKIEARGQIDLKTSKAAIDKVEATIGDGTVKVSGTIEDYLIAQKYDMTLNAQNLKIQDLAGQENGPAKAEGIISADIKVKGAGFTPEAVKSTLSGDGNISAKSIMLKDMNVLKIVLDKISVIPNLSEKVQANLPEKYKQKLTRSDTALSDISLPIAIEKGQILIKDLDISADEFTFKGQAMAGLEGTFSSEGSFVIPAELSAAMVAGVSQLQYLLNPEKQIYIPLKVSGKFPKVEFSVDPVYMGEKLVQNQVQTQLIKVIDKAIGNKEPGAPASGAQPTGAEEKKATTADLVTGALGLIFGK